MQYGTYTTFDCPTAHEDNALNWLAGEFNKISGTVRRKLNSHDFGAYPSFEVNYPYSIKELIDDTFDADDTDYDANMAKIDAWHDKADAIYKAYSDKFGKWL